MSVRTSAVRVDFSGARSIAELVPGGLSVFTPDERRHCGARRDLSSWAGRWAAKLALAQLYAATGAVPGDFEVLPSRRDCPRTGPCDDGHPPQVRMLRPELSGERVTLSISHDGGTAVAVVLVQHP